MAIPGVGPIGASGVSQLAQQWQQQIISGAFDTPKTAVAPAGAAGATSSAATPRSVDFADTLGRGLEEVSRLDQTAKSKSVQAATGDLTEIHDYVIAATEAQTAAELTTTVRNKALEAFNEIMRMQL